MRFSGVIRSVGVQPTKDASQIKVSIIAETRRGIVEQLVRLMMADVSITIEESQLQLPETEEAGQ